MEKCLSIYAVSFNAVGLGATYDVISGGLSAFNSFRIPSQQWSRFRPDSMQKKSGVKAVSYFPVIGGCDVYYGKVLTGGAFVTTSVARNFASVFVAKTYIFGTCRMSGFCTFWLTCIKKTLKI
jgi:hypothetical protein